MVVALAEPESKNDCADETSGDLSETRQFFPEFGRTNRLLSFDKVWTA
jgi:hypothetical protein